MWLKVFRMAIQFLYCKKLVLQFLLNEEVTIMTNNQKGFAKNPELAAEAGKKGGQNSGGNFKNDPEKASEAGKKGGQNSHGGGRQS